MLPSRVSLSIRWPSFKLTFATDSELESSRLMRCHCCCYSSCPVTICSQGNPLRVLVSKTRSRTSPESRLSSQSGSGQKWLLSCQEGSAQLSLQGRPPFSGHSVIDSLRRTMQIVECSLLRQRAQGRVSSQPRTPSSICENLLYPECMCPSPPPQIP